jgi:hypothetical protein
MAITNYIHSVTICRKRGKPDKTHRWILRTPDCTGYCSAFVSQATVTMMDAAAVVASIASGRR